MALFDPLQSLFRRCGFAPMGGVNAQA